MSEDSAIGTPLELDAAGVRAYVLGSLRLRGSFDDDLARRTIRALGWYRQLTMRARAKGVLFSWIYDLGHLLVEGDRFSFRSLADLSAWPERERGLRLEYENRLLNGFLRDPSIKRAIEHIGLDTSRERLIARALELLLGPLVSAGGHEQAPIIDPILLRELSFQGALDPTAEAAAYDALAGEEALLTAARSSLDRYFGSRPPGPALHAEDLAEIDHWSAYQKAAQRLAGRRISRRAAAFPRLDLAGVAIAKEEETEAELPDSGYYPQGGFAELANRGALENLVPAELVYMGEDPFGDEPDPPIDLFALRYLENETLFFSRDSGQLRRTRRTVHAAVAPDDGLRLQLRWHEDPLIVLVYGLFVRLSEDLGQIFPGDALRLEVHLLCSGGAERDRAEEDRRLLRVLLRHEISRGAAEVTLGGRGLDLRTLGRRDRRVYGLAVQSGDRRPAGLPDTPSPRPASGEREPRILVWQIGGREPGPRDTSRVTTPLEGSPESSLIEARDALLSEISGIGTRRRLQGGAQRKPTQSLPAGLERGEVEGELVNARDASVLVWVPPGTCRLGDADANPERNALLPQRTLDVQTGYFIGKYPVTWEQYRAFCADTGRAAPRALFDVGPRHPVHGVSVSDANAYCAWARVRLPTEEEWECAARGADARPYPWGFEDPDSGGVLRLACGRDPDGSEGTTAPVGSFQDASPFGCHDMSGNVWEWVVSPEAPTDSAGSHWARGGCWNTAPWDCQASARTRIEGRSPWVGFRVCRA